MRLYFKMKRARPFIAINVAMTADGKIAPANRKFVPFTTPRDHELMLELRSQHDAVMSGARTIDLGPVTLPVGGAKYLRKRRARGLADAHIRVLVSGSGSIDPKSKIFESHFGPIIIFTTEKAGQKRLKTLSKLADALHVSPGKNLDFAAACQWLRREWKVKTLLCEGGGAVNGGLFEAQLVDRIYLTIAPSILGGRNAPTPADGRGFPELSHAARFGAKSIRRVGDELYAVFDAR